MKSRIFAICSTAALLGGAVFLNGCLSEEEEPMPPDAKIIPAPAPDSQALSSSSPTLTPQDPGLVSPKSEAQFQPVPVAQIPTTKKAPAPAKKTAVRAPSAGSQTYIVKNRDSYWKIARNFGVSWSELQTANKNAKLRPGMKIVIPAGASRKAAASKATVKSKKTSAKTPASGSETVYVVKAGDNFSKIAKRYGVKAADIADLNGIPLTKMLQVGQKLRIPARGAKVKKSAVAKSAPAAPKKTAAKKADAGKTEEIAPLPKDEPLPAVPEVPGADAKTAPAVDANAPAVPAVDGKANVPAVPPAVDGKANTPAAEPAATYEVVKTDKDYSFDELAKKYNCTVAELKSLNPQITGNIVPGDTNIKLP